MATGQLAVPSTCIAILSGSILGNQASYLLGRYGRRTLRQRRENFQPELPPAVTATTLLTYHFVYVLRTTVPFTSGVMKLPYSYWAILDTTGRTFWLTVLVAGGATLGEAATLRISNICYLLGCIALLFCAGYIIIRGLRKRRLTRNTAGTTEDSR